MAIIKSPPPLPLFSSHHPQSASSQSCILPGCHMYKQTNKFFGNINDNNDNGVKYTNYIIGKVKYTSSFQFTDFHRLHHLPSCSTFPTATVMSCQKLSPLERPPKLTQLLPLLYFTHLFPPNFNFVRQVLAWRRKAVDIVKICSMSID